MKSAIGGGGRYVRSRGVSGLIGVYYGLLCLGFGGST